jgi:hypothetical protein
MELLIYLCNRIGIKENYENLRIRKGNKKEKNLYLKQ